MAANCIPRCYNMGDSTLQKSLTVFPRSVSTRSYDLTRFPGRDSHKGGRSCCKLRTCLKALSRPFNRCGVYNFEEMQRYFYDLSSISQCFGRVRGVGVMVEIWVDSPKSSRLSTRRKGSLVNKRKRFPKHKAICHSEEYSSHLWSNPNKRERECKALWLAAQSVWNLYSRGCKSPANHFASNWPEAFISL